MKILKVELQNINSLKSDTTIVIDFENEKFKDVGLYAITGSTGAGKTTILDAITIALYLSVPRFKTGKGALLDVVSHGANYAFTRVTFENNNFLYEGYWDIRLANKKGESLKKPIETVSLKNLSTGKIIADQKRKYIEEVEKATQLDYKQFLRSVMLAQGQFASFLSAGGTEKGKLLEQITGEQIYKKIGQGILDRKSLEESKLKEIEAKINSDDVLTEEKKAELLARDKALAVDIKLTEEEIKSSQLIKDWYDKYQKTIDESKKLELVSKELEVFIGNHKTELELLALNEKAEPFKELIQDLKRTDKEIIDKQQQVSILEKELILLKPEIEHLTTISKNQIKELTTAEKDFDLWLPKFELITTFDNKQKNGLEIKQQSEKKLTDLNIKVKSLEEKNRKFRKELSDLELKIKEDETFVTKNNFLNKVASEISNWTRELTTLKANKVKLEEDSEFIINKSKEIKETVARAGKGKGILSKKIIEKEKLEKELVFVSEQLSKNNIKNLIKAKESLLNSFLKWKEFKRLSVQTLKATKEKEEFLAKQKIYTTDLNVIEKQITEQEKLIVVQENSITDAEKILELEKSIAKYETDRAHLIKGKPCGLCGSTIHPFAEGLESIGVSKSALEVSTRKQKLKLLVDTKNSLKLKVTELKTAINGLHQQIKTVSEDIVTFNLSVKELNIDCDVTNKTKIDSELILLNDQIELTNKKLTISQESQKTKDKLLLDIETVFKEEHKIKTGLATLDEKIKNTKLDIKIKQQSVEDLAKISADLKTLLTAKLSQYNYELPSTINTELFIKNIEESITALNKKQKNLDGLKASVKIIQTNIDNNQKNLADYKAAITECSKSINDCSLKIDEIKNKRADILPLSITVEDKRKTLQSTKNKLTEKVELCKKELQKRIDTKTEKEALKVDVNKLQKQLLETINNLQVELANKLKGTGFNTKEEVEKALLSIDIKLKYAKNKEEIDKRKIKLTTLNKLNITEKEVLLKSKNFEISELDNKKTFDNAKLKKDVLLTEKGKIAEAYRKDNEIRDRNKETYKKIEAQLEVCGVWKELFKLIGNSKDAFNVYVQRLTLKQLLDLANVHLFQLNKRYSLKMEDAYKPKEELNFNLIDHYQTDQVRLVDTSSGGEKFIISLALALGLSDLASKNVKIDSLFIDEGFGTLDANTLETVISTLETLQAQGKMIGIISHVENLKERIATQIKITKKSNGVSTVAIL